jgi:nucleoside-diphosphate-sugar epimerase
MTAQRVLILGYGRLGQAFCRLYHAAYAIRGIKRTPLPPLPDAPCDVVCTPIHDAALQPHLAWADVVIFCPASGRNGGGRDGERDAARYRETYLGNMQYLTALMMQASIHSGGPRVVILIGSTGVYPRSTGGVWSEERPIPIETPRQEVLLLTEQVLIRSGLPFVILRCGGLYGEGRDNLAWIGRRKELHSTELTDELLSLVHQDDVCGVIDRVIERGVSNEIFNVRDDSALTRKALYTLIAARAGVPILERGPAPAPPVPSVPIDRRIPNDKLKTQLGYRFSRPPMTAYLTGTPAIS